MNDRDTLSRDARALVEAARAAEGYPAKVDARVATALGVTAVVATQGVTGAKAAATTATAAKTTGTLVSTWVAPVLIGGAVAGSWAIAERASDNREPLVLATPPPAPSAPVFASPSASTVAKPPSPEPAAAVPSSTSTPPRPRGPVPRRPPAPSETLGPEADLLSRAQRALRAGDPTRALELLEQHRSDHRTGAMEEERKNREKCEEIVDFLEITDIRDTAVGKLPYGLQ
ncbi:MAG: hypothetical protein AAGA56_17880, partial [Myxococcota bacterium]